MFRILHVHGSTFSFFMATRRELRTAAPPSVADARRTATGTPAGWTRRAASRALQTGKRQSGVYAVELRPGGAARFILQRRDDTGRLGTQGRQWGDKPHAPSADRQHLTASEDMPDADNTSEGEAANTDNMAVDAGQETSKAKQRSQRRLASHGKALGFLKGLVFKRWIGAVQQEKQQREQQRRAEAAASAEAAAAAAAKAARRVLRERELGALRRDLEEVRRALKSSRASEADLNTRTQQLEGQLWWQWSPGQGDECEPRWSHASGAAVGEQWPPEAASETMAAEGRGKGRKQASGYRKGNSSRDRGYG